MFRLRKMTYNKGFWTVDDHSIEKTIQEAKKMSEKDKKEEIEINWTEEADSLKEKGGMYWKPTPGKYIVVFLSNGVEGESEFQGETIKKVRFDISVNKETFFWDITRGVTSSSLFGQIALVARANDGKLIEQKITLLVKGTGKETQYVVEEALELMSKEEK